MYKLRPFVNKELSLAQVLALVNEYMNPEAYMTLATRAEFSVELDPEYVAIAKKRLKKAKDGMNKRGRPPLSELEPTVKRTVTLTESQAEFLRLYGDGNTSRGVQWLVDEKREETND